MVTTTDLIGAKSCGRGVDRIGNLDQAREGQPLSVYASDISGCKVSVKWPWYVITTKHVPLVSDIPALVLDGAASDR